jgi:trehalose utilization protein
VGANCGRRIPNDTSGRELELTTRVLTVDVWWGHQLHRYVADDAVDGVVRHGIKARHGVVALHSAHRSKPFTRPIGDTGRIGVAALEGSEHITAEDPTHPIAQGVGPVVLEESFDEPFEWGKARHGDLAVGVLQRSRVPVRSGPVCDIGERLVFYFRPRHEMCPSLFDPSVHRIIRNAVPVEVVTMISHAPLDLLRGRGLRPGPGAFR